ncbi:MAG: CTP synthetase [Halobacteriales archaeon]|nr:CTP synthetase [Halobacteriales archaeon]
MSRHAVIAGPDRGIETAFADRGVEIVRLDGPGTGASLEAAGIETAEFLILTDVDEATLIPIALEVNPELVTVVYTPDTIPEFVRGQLDLALDPELFAPETVAEELTGPNDADPSNEDGEREEEEEPA